MALIKCSECGREISDKAANCIGCGAPIVKVGNEIDSLAPTSVKYDPTTETFSGTRLLLVKLASKAIVALSWKLDSIDEANGLVSFTTGVTWGSWSGVSGSMLIEEVEPFVFRVVGTAKQNVKGGQLIALNLFDEAGKKVQKIINEMRNLAR